MSQSETAKQLLSLPQSLLTEFPVPEQYRDHHKPVWERKLVKDNPYLLNNYFIEKILALKLYGDLYIEWLFARAIKKESFSWRFGNLSLRQIQVFSYDGKENPIVEFDEFYGMLKAAYCI